MGKRKLHGSTYYLCDWTGFPMSHANCFMPTWTSEGKLVKRGTYCNWEAVLAHAEYMHSHPVGDQTVDMERVKQFISAQTGGSAICHFNKVNFTNLCHFGGHMNMNDYHKACCYSTHEVFAVKINEAGHTSEILVGTKDGVIDVKSQIKLPTLVTQCTQPSMFYSCRNRKQTDTDICVFHYNGKNGCELNPLASNIFKMQIYGEVLMVRCSKEQSFMPRERYVSYTITDFEENFLRKRKRANPEQTSLLPKEYDALKAEMEVSLSTYEKEASSLAQPLAETRKVARMPPPDGRKLAKLAKHQKEMECL